MALHLVRHAKAGDRRRWQGPDDRRPLSPAGHRQADALVDLLGPSPIERVLSSPFLRCVQTVEPLADKLGLAVEVEPALGEGPDIAAVLALLEGLATSGTEAVLCSHGDVIPLVVAAVERRGATVVTSDWSVRKGSVWTVEVGAGGRFLTATYVPPPV